ncbi:uncharacterized protein LOC116485338 [Aythya fuligula]|uniref:Uncharacterized protein LOC116485338 n=1 Tax=Aythya fuligula TaxID=219594 RepID=A0A6J3CEJ8_AYTFU|nr:uncharacterized protein LOC116485338 [Aythya fuligula]
MSRVFRGSFSRVPARFRFPRFPADLFPRSPRFPFPVSYRESFVQCLRLGVWSGAAPVRCPLRCPLRCPAPLRCLSLGAVMSRRRWSPAALVPAPRRCPGARRRWSQRRWSPALPAFGCAGAAGVPLRWCPAALRCSPRNRCDVRARLRCLLRCCDVLLRCDVCPAAMSCSGPVQVSRCDVLFRPCSGLPLRCPVQALFRSPAAMSCSGPVQVSACSGRNEIEMIITLYMTEERLEEEGNTDMQQNCTGKNLNPEEMPIRTPQRERFERAWKCREAAEEAAVVAETGPTQATGEC